MKNIKYIFDEESDDMGIFSVDVVGTPANGLEFVLMSDVDETKEEVLMSSIDSERKVAVGPVLVPGKPFKRSNGRMATMDAGNITKAMEDFMMNHNNGESRIHHRYNTNDIKVIQNWQVDRNKGVLPGYGFDSLPDGTWMQMQKFSDEVWEKDVKSGEVKGFSIQAKMRAEEVAMSNFDALHDELNDILNNIKQ